MRHTRIQTPAHVIWVEHRPSNSGKGKTSYCDAVRVEATAEVGTAITASDIEVNIVYSTDRKPLTRLDADNVSKPTLDALKGVAYADDRQVRSVTSSIFDRTVNNVVDGKVEHLGKLFYSPKPDVVLIMIYSDTRLAELGGEQEVQRRRYETWGLDFEQALVRIREAPA